MVTGKVDLTILSTEGRDAAAWKYLFNRLPRKYQDIHFSLDYGRAYERSYGRKVCLAVYGDENSFLLMPFALLDVCELPWTAGAEIDGPVYDMTSLYTFGGPVGRFDAGAESQLHSGLHEALKQYCLNKRIVTQFVAFHPLLENHRGVQETGLVEIKPRKTVVWIDLSGDPGDLFRDLRLNHRRSIAKARRLGIRAGPQPWNPSAMKTFEDLYFNKMQSVQANGRWLLPENYCKNFVEFLGPERVSLFNATSHDTIIASSLTLHGNEIAYHHLTGACDEALRLCAHHLLVYELALWAKSKGCAQLHLGAGLAPDDNIFHFKAGFSNRRSWLFTANIVYDNDMYQRLCEVRNRFDQIDDDAPLSNEFFPAYRR